MLYHLLLFQKDFVSKNFQVEQAQTLISLLTKVFFLPALIAAGILALVLRYNCSSSSGQMSQGKTKRKLRNENSLWKSAQIRSSCNLITTNASYF